MRKVLFILAFIMPMIFMCSCSDEDDGGTVEKEQLIGTWLLVSEIGDYTCVAVIFRNTNQFELITYSKVNAEDGTVSEKGEARRGTYTLKKDKISFDNKYTLLIKSFEEDTLEGEIDFGNGIYKAIAKKQ